MPKLLPVLTAALALVAAASPAADAKRANV